MFANEQQKLYHAQFQQFGKKFLFKWVNDKLMWTEDCIHSRYAERADVSIVTKEEIAEWSISPEMLRFVKYIAELKRDIETYLGEALEGVILRDGIEILLNELYHGQYIPQITQINGNDETVLISYHGLYRLHLDFRFMMVTLQKLMSTASRNLCTSICDKARKYVNFKYNLKVEVDWKLMHALAKKLSYKVLTGDELTTLDRVHQETEPQSQSAYSSGYSGGSSGYSGPTRKKRISSTKNRNNPFNM